jgi:hypothetical protein
VRLRILVVVIAALAGVLLSALAMTWYLNRDNRWFKIASPTNETAIQILAVDRSLNAYVGTQQGNLYLCGGRTWRDVCRKVATDELPLNKVPAQWRTCASVAPLWPALPGAVVDSLEVGRCAEATTYSKLVILSDGSLWQWRRTFSWVNQFALMMGVVLGLLAGILGGILVVRLRRSLRGT